MPIANWPASLPQCFILGHEEQLGDGLIRSQTDTGPAKIRRRSSAMPGAMSGSMRMTTDQLTTLRSFVTTTLMGAALPFTFPNQRGGSLARVRLSSPPSWSRMTGRIYYVSIALEVLP